jgi:hypothetical protein
MDCTLLVLAHPGKSEDRADTIRGAGELSADPDVLWTVHRPRPGRHVVTCIKDRDGDVEGRRFAYSVRTNHDRTVTVLVSAEVEDQGNPRPAVETAVINALLAAKSPLPTCDLVAAAREQTGVSEVTVHRALAALKASGSAESLRRGLWTPLDANEPSIT